MNVRDGLSKMRVLGLATVLLGLAACGGTGDGASATAPAVPAAPAAPAAPSAPASGRVCTAEMHTCVLQPSGTVLCAGRNRDGQLGDGTAQDRLGFVPVVGLTSAIDIDCAYGHTCAARSDGHVVCWGRSAEGQLGASTTPVQAPVEVAGITDAVEVSTGRAFSCARRRTGAVVCWGGNDDGQLGNATRTSSTAPVEATGLADAAEIDSGFGHTCARRATGAVVCWGLNGSGALGTGDTTVAHHPVEVAGVVGATMIGAGGYHSCAVSPAGLACWGGNYNAQIGNGNEEEQSVTHPATLAGITGVTSLALGAQRTCIATESEVRCWGYNDFTAGLLGIENDAIRNILTPTAVAGITDAVALASGHDFSCAIRRGGALSCWGSGDDGQMGEGSRQGHPARDAVANVLTLAVPASVPATFVASAAPTEIAPHVAIGSSHVCTVLANGHVRCFGENGDGQLGNGSTLSTSSSRATDVPGLTDAVRVVAYNQTTCAVRANGEVACWGTLAGFGTPVLPESSSLPVPIALTEAVDVAIAGGTFCAATRAGGVRCLGEGGSGQLGNGATTDSATAVDVTGLTDVRRIAATASTICALRSAGTVACWGYDHYGECGNGTAAECGASAVEVEGLSHVTQIDGWGYGLCAIEGDAVQCWGANDYGQLGNGTADRAVHGDAPAVVRGVRHAVQVGVGSGSLCATTEEGEAFCWGSNAFGASGADDAQEDGHDPETTAAQVHRTADPAVAAFAPYVATDCGSSFCCGVHRDGNLSCWGSTPLGGSGGFLGFSSVRSAHPIVAPGITIPVPPPAPQ